MTIFIFQVFQSPWEPCVNLDLFFPDIFQIYGFPSQSKILPHLKKKYAISDIWQPCIASRIFSTLICMV